LIISIIDIPQTINSGDYYYRTYSPGIALSMEKGIYVISLSRFHPKINEIALLTDILILHDICDPDLLPIIAERKKNNRPTFFEIADDMNGLQSWNPVYEFYQNKDNIRLIYKLANYCDGLQFSVAKLQNIYGILNKYNKVFSNQILYIPPMVNKHVDNNIIIGWGGSHGHRDDIAAIAKQLIDWINTKQNVKLHLMCSKPIYSFFENLPDHKKRYFPVGSITDYFEFLSTIHIGIAPLNDTPFNRSRSDVKFLEYAVSGTVPVMADLEPYQNTVDDGKNGFLYKDTSDLISKLEFLSDKPEIRNNITKVAKEYIVTKRQQVFQNQERLEFYTKIITSSNRESEELFCRWSNYASTEIKGKFLTLNNSDFEKQICAGLAMINSSIKNNYIEEFFKHGIMHEPNNYLPYLIKSRISSKPICDLSHALFLEPSSIKTCILLGEEYEKLGMNEDALNMFNRAAGIFKDYDIPFSKSSALLMKLGLAELANELEKIAKSKQINII
jgi:glycosyltransferase involved in cell wall biosynthesis